MLRLWENAFKDEPYKKVVNVINKWVLENKYMPTIAEVKAKLPPLQQIQTTDVWHKRFGYGSDPIYYDDDFSERVIWEDVPKDIRDRMQYHCNPKDYEEYNKVASYIHEKWGNPVKIYTDADMEFLKGKTVTWKNELSTQAQ